MTSTTKRRWALNQIALVPILFIVGTLLAILKPIWFAPPNFGSTFLAYLALLLAWFPALIGLLIYHRATFGQVFLTIGLGVVTMVVVLALVGPNLFSAGPFSTLDCASHEAAPGETEYICTELGIMSHQSWRLIGPTGFPLARLESSSGLVFTP